MDLSNLRFNRIAAHRVPRKPAPDAEIQPQYGDDLVDLGRGGRDILTQRITEVMGHPSYSVEMKVRRNGNGSTFQHSALLTRASEEDFLAGSKHVTDNLNEAQTRTDIPESVLLVGRGKVGAGQNNVIALVKAETQDGFSLADEEGNLRVDFITDLFLTPDQKLYKIGLLVETSDETVGQDLRSVEDFEALVYDSNLRRSNDPAKYFYERFLGCDFVRSGKELTKAFFDRHQEYFDTLDVDEEERKDLKTHLYSYLKSERNLINTAEFANDYLDSEKRPRYFEFMEQHDVPERAIEKDLSRIQSSLKRRRIKFKNGVKISGKADRFDESVKIESEQEDTTLVRINDGIDEQR